jgi:precorrin-6B methylase 2
LYKKIIPAAIRTARSRCIEEGRRREKIKEISSIYAKIPKRRLKELTVEEVDISNFINGNPIVMIPYEYIKRYNANEIVVYTDNDCQMQYVLHNNKRLYFPKKESWYSKTFDDETIRVYYNNLLVEQDINSPHRYESANVQVQSDDVIADIGAAEGLFALSVIEKVKRVYLFEVAPEWIDALKFTFAPYKEKVTIINKYVSDLIKNDSVTLDNYFAGKEINFIKSDIEGCESKLLKGAKNILKARKNLRLAICTYHHENHAKDFKMTLETNGFLTEFSKGYIVPTWMPGIEDFNKILEKCNYYDNFKKGNIIPLWNYSPFFRKGVIRAIKAE